MFQKIFIFLFILFSCSAFASSKTLGLYSVNADVLKIRLGPNSQFEHSYNMYNNQRTNVYEFKDGWARVSKSANHSKWAYGKYLTQVNKNSIVSQKPAKRKKKSQVKKKVPKPKFDTRLVKYIAKSDNYKKHSKVFINVSQRLISQRVCRISDFRKTSGWMELSEDEMYFTYCGGFNKKDKIYINLVTNEIIGNMKKYK